jgi:hypothetical protein
MKRIILTLGLATLLAAVTPAMARAVDITVAGVEVTQATQTTTNSIRLVAKKSTAVRATLATGAMSPLAGVTGKLHVFVAGVEITPAAGVSAINQPFTAPTAPLRNNESDTLNFELPAPTGIPASTDVDFRVDLDSFAGETNTTNNSGSANNLTAVKRSVPLLYYTRIDYTPSGLGLPDVAKVQPGTGDAFVRGILPVDDSNSALYRESSSPTMTYAGDSNGDGRLDGFGTDATDLLDQLEATRQLMVQTGSGVDDKVFLYGWIAGNPIDGNGVAYVNGRVAFGNTEDVRYQRSYAHELTHNFGLSHNSLSLDEVGWDVGARLVNNPAGNNENSRAKKVTAGGGDFDIQNAGRLTNEAWIHTSNYNFLLDHATLQPPPCFTIWCNAEYRVASIRGSLLKGAVLAHQVYRYPWLSQPSSPDAKGDYVAEITDTNGVKTSRRFGADMSDDLHRESKGFFSVLVPLDPKVEIATLRITDAAGKELALIKGSKPPTISILSPKQGAGLGGKTEVAWSVSDPDTPLSQLQLQAAYSYDKGSSWVPVKVAVPGTSRSFSFDPSSLPKSEGKGMIRLFASDGLNTAYASVDGLTR